jgi:hypothetical protein
MERTCGEEEAAERGVGSNFVNSLSFIIMLVLAMKSVSFVQVLDNVLFVVHFRHRVANSNKRTFEQTAN